MKSNLDSLFKTDKDMEATGIWFEVTEGVKFRMKRLGGTNQREIKKAHTKYYKPFMRQIQNGVLPYSKELEISIKAFVDAILVDWEGVEVDDKPLEFSKENACKLLSDMPDLFDILNRECTNKDNFLEELGNS